MRIINYSQVLMAMARAVENKPAGYVQEGPCINHDGEQPICIVGTLLADLLGGIADIPPRGPARAAVLELRTNSVADFTQAAFIAMNTAQNFQDTGSTWAEAYKAADLAVASYLLSRSIAFDQEI